MLIYWTAVLDCLIVTASPAFAFFHRATIKSSQTSMHSSLPIHCLWWPKSMKVVCLQAKLRDQVPLEVEHQILHTEQNTSGLQTSQDIPKPVNISTCSETHKHVYMLNIYNYIYICNCKFSQKSETWIEFLCQVVRSGSQPTWKAQQKQELYRRHGWKMWREASFMHKGPLSLATVGLRHCPVAYCHATLPILSCLGRNKVQ